MKNENTINSKKVLFILAMTWSLFGCTGAENNSIDLQSDPNDKGELSKFTLIDGSGFKGIKNFDRTERTNLVELPVDPRFNAQVFISHDSSDPIYTGAAFIVPKLFAYGNQQGGAVVVKKHSNGNYTLSFNVGFIDGKSSTFLDAKSQNKINVPNAYLIQDWEGLKNNLTSSFNIDEKK